MASNGPISEPRMAFFSSSHYRVHNQARLQHLASLGLPISGRVLEVGAGPGDHTSFYLQRGCAVVSTDAREECVQALKARYPQITALRVDMNHPEPLTDLGQFDIVHCYGLLYHLERPEAAIEAMSGVCANLLLLETCVSLGQDQEVKAAEEVISDYTQSVTGHACRPTRPWVFETLKKYFPFVYQTRTQPIHPEFPIDWTAVPLDHGLIRIVLVASRREQNLPVLSSELLDHQERLEHATRAEVEVRDMALEDLRQQILSLQDQLQRANERAALLQSAAEERLALLNQATQEIETLQHKGLIGYLVYLKNQRRRQPR